MNIKKYLKGTIICCLLTMIFCLFINDVIILRIELFLFLIIILFYIKEIKKLTQN